MFSGSALAVAGIAGLVSAGISSQGAKSAANAQANATNQATANQARQFDLTRADYAPYLAAGTGAVDKLSTLMGTGGDPNAPDYGSLNKKFSLADFWSDPVTMASYQSGLDIGTKALQNQAGARGSLNSGAQLKALTRFGTDYTGNQAAGSQARFVGDQTNTYNRLAGIAGTGQTAAGTVAQTGQAATTNTGNLLTAQGNARGAAAIATGNAYGNAFTNTANNYMQQQTLNQLLAQQNQPNQNGYTF